MYHGGSLSGEKTAMIPVTFLHGQAQSAAAHGFQHLVRSAAIFCMGIFPRKSSSQTTHRMPQALARDHGAEVPCFQDLFPVIGMNGALRRAEETCAHLHTAGTQHKRSGCPAAASQICGTSTMVVSSPT